MADRERSLPGRERSPDRDRWSVTRLDELRDVSLDRSAVESAVRANLLMAWYLLVGAGTVLALDYADPSRTVDLVGLVASTPGIAVLLGAVGVASLRALGTDVSVDRARVVRTSILYLLLIAAVYFAVPLLRGTVGV